MDFKRPQRVLYKISGELLSSEGKPICEKKAQEIAEEFVRVHHQGHELIIVCGAGNIMRGRSAQRVERASVDAAGMLATYVNAMMLHGCMGDTPCTLFGTGASAYVQPYNFTMCLDAMQSGHVVFLVGGSGLPYFSTDTLAAVRARELRCNVLIKGTSVDGVYSADPKKYKEARLIERLTYTKAMEEKLGFMDIMAHGILCDSGVQTCVFNRKKYTLDQFLAGEGVPYSLVE